MTEDEICMENETKCLHKSQGFYIRDTYLHT